METIRASLLQLDDTIKHKLADLPAIKSSKEIKELNSFLAETLILRNTLTSLLTTDPDVCEEEYEEERSIQDTDIIDIVTKLCDLTIGFYQVRDPKRIKEYKAEWLIDDAWDLITELREALGNRIPAMPGSEASRN